MDQIKYYIMDMLPYICLAFPIHILLRSFILSKKSKMQKINISREGALLFFSLYLTGLASQTIIPDFVIYNNHIYAIDIGFHADRINVDPFNKIIETQILVENGHKSYLVIEVFGNIGMFLPIGFLLPLLWRRFENILWTVFVCFGISFFIETTQLFLPRGTDVDDLIMNTLGGTIGFFLYFISKKFPTRFHEKFKFTLV